MGQSSTVTRIQQLTGAEGGTGKNGEVTNEAERGRHCNRVMRERADEAGKDVAAERQRQPKDSDAAR